MMTDKEKLLLAIMQTKNVMSLNKDNPYEQYMYRHLSTVLYELKRQLTNLTFVEESLKLEKQSPGDDD